MSPICSFLVIFLIAPQATGQGFLGANNATQDASKAAKAESMAKYEASLDKALQSRLTTLTAKAKDPPATVNLAASANDVLMDDGSEKLSRDSDEDDQTETSDAPPGVDSTAADDGVDDGSDSELRGFLQSEVKSLRKDLKTGDDSDDGEESNADQDESEEDTDKLQNEVSKLQDEVVRRDTSHQHDDDDDDADKDANEIQTGVDDFQNELAHEDTETQGTDLEDSTAGEEGDITKDAGLLQNMVKHLLKDSVISKEEKQRIEEDPEVITVLIQTLKKHAHKIGGAGGEDSENLEEEMGGEDSGNFDEDYMALADGDEDESLEDDDAGEADGEAKEALGEGFEESDDESSEDDEPLDDESSESADDETEQMEDDADDESQLGLIQTKESHETEMEDDDVDESDEAEAEPFSEEDTDEDNEQIKQEVDALEDEGAQDAAATMTKASGVDEEAAAEADERLQDESESLVASEAA